eukprot:jgi/Tetstr1/449402/TSEL_036497.t1
MRGAAHAAAWVGGAAGGGSPNGRAVSTPTQAPPLTSDDRLPKETCRLVVSPAGVRCRRRYRMCDGAVASGTAPHVEQHVAVLAPPMSRATSSQHPATTASATADGAVAGGDALPGDDDALGAPRQEAEEAVVEATDRAEGVVEASEAALAPPAPQPPAGHADLLVAMPPPPPHPAHPTSRACLLGSLTQGGASRVVERVPDMAELRPHRGRGRAGDCPLMGRHA